jgi:hypothetical protein
MRLFELANNIDDLVLILRNLIGRADSESESQKITYSALNELLKNIGSNILVNKDYLTQLQDDNTQVTPLIQNLDDNEITLATRVVAQEPKNASLDVPSGKSVEQMARSAARRQF